MTQTVGHCGGCTIGPERKTVRKRRGGHGRKGTAGSRSWESQTATRLQEGSLPACNNIIHSAQNKKFEAPIRTPRLERAGHAHRAGEAPSHTEGAGPTRHGEPRQKGRKQRSHRLPECPACVAGCSRAVYMYSCCRAAALYHHSRIDPSTTISSWLSGA